MKQIKKMLILGLLLFQPLSYGLTESKKEDMRKALEQNLRGMSFNERAIVYVGAAEKDCKALKPKPGPFNQVYADCLEKRADRYKKYWEKRLKL